MASYTHTIVTQNPASSYTINMEVGDSISVAPPSGVVAWGIYGTSVNVPGCTYSLIVAPSWDSQLYSLSGTVTAAGTYALKIYYQYRTNLTSKYTLTLNVKSSTPAQYTISFNSNGGSSNPSSKTVTAGQSITLPSPGSKSGYTFNGWYSAIRNTVVGGYGDSYTPSGSEELTARWTEVVYTHYLYYDANGGSGAPSTQSHNTSSNTSYTFTISSTTPYRSGFEFQGWSTSSSATSASYQPGGTISVSANSYKTLYAVWKQVYNYSLSFNANGGSGAPSTVSESSTSTSLYLSIPTEVPTRTNYEFLGWSESSTATSASYSAGSSVRLTSSSPTKVLYAVWKQVYNYWIIFSARDGYNETTVPSVHEQSTSTSIYLTIPDTIPTRSGYEFVGWAEGRDATEAEYYVGSSVHLTSSDTSITLYAVWAKVYTYTLSFNVNGGTGGPSTITRTTTDEEVSIQIPTTEPTRDGYEFYGWYYADAGYTYDPGEYITLRYDQNLSVVLKADWREIIEFSVTFNANGGTGAPSKLSTQSTSGPQNFTIPWTEPTRDGYYFLGWSTSSSATTAEYYTNDTISVYAASPAVTLYAVWLKWHTYTLSFNLNGGEGNVPDVVIEDYELRGQPMGIEIPYGDSDVSKADYYLKGWGKTSTASSVYQQGEQVDVSADSTVTLYAIWEPIVWEYVLYYDANGGTNAPFDDVENTTALEYTFTVSSEVPSFNDYEFLGWHTDKNASVPLYRAGDRITMTRGGSTVLYAIYVWPTFELWYDANKGDFVPSTSVVMQEYRGPQDRHSFTILDTVPVREGYEFLGWGTSNNTREVSYKAGDSISIRADAVIRIYAIWMLSEATYDTPQVRVYRVVNDLLTYNVHAYIDLTDMLISGYLPTVYKAMNRAGYFSFAITHDPVNSILSDEYEWNDGQKAALTWGQYVEIVYKDVVVAEGFITTLQLRDHDLWIECADNLAVLDNMGVTSSRNYYDTRTATATFNALSGGEANEILVDIASIRNADGLIEPPIYYRINFDVKITESTSDNAQFGLIGSGVHMVEWTTDFSTPFSGITLNFGIYSTLYGQATPVRIWVLDSSGNTVAYAVQTVPNQERSTVSFVFDTLISEGKYTVRIQPDPSISYDSRYSFYLRCVDGALNGTSVWYEDSTGEGQTIARTPLGVIRTNPYKQVTNYTLNDSIISITGIEEVSDLTSEKAALVQPSNDRVRISYYTGTINAAEIIEDLLSMSDGVVGISYYNKPVLNYPEVTLFRVGGMHYLDYVKKLLDLTNTQDRQLAIHVTKGMQYKEAILGLAGQLGLRKKSTDAPDLEIVFGSLNHDAIMLSFTPELSMKNRPSQIMMRGTVSNKGETESRPVIACLKNLDLSASRKLVTDRTVSSSNALTVKDMIAELWSQLKQDENEWGGEIELSGIHVLFHESGDYAGSGKVLGITDMRYFTEPKNFVVQDYEIDFNKMTTKAKLSTARAVYSNSISETERMIYSTSDVVFGDSKTTLYNGQYAFLDLTRIGQDLKPSGNTAQLIASGTGRSVQADTFEAYVLPDDYVLYYLKFTIGDEDLSSEKYAGDTVMINTTQNSLGSHAVDVYAGQTVIINILSGRQS